MADPTLQNDVIDVNDQTLAIPTRSRAKRRLRRGLALVAAVAVVAGAVLSVRSAGGTSAGYRTTAASHQDVAATLSSVGTVEPVTQASVSFPVDGTVESVFVSTGDPVAVGQSLATLDVTSLERALNMAKADLADAELTLEKALNGEDVSSPSGSSSGGSSGSGGDGASATGVSHSASSGASRSSGAVSVQYVALAPSSPSATGSTASADAELRAAQEAVLAAQRQADADLAAAQAALDSATAICTALGDADVLDGVDDMTTPTTSPTSTTAATVDRDVAACRDALQAVLDAQSTVAASQAAVDAAADALTDLLADLSTELSTDLSTELSATTGTAGSDGSSDSGGRSGSGSSGGSMSGSGSSGGSGGSGGAVSGSTTGISPTAAELILFQKKLDAAEAQVAVAEQAVAQGAIVSPIAGTVVSVGLAVGDAVTAGSSTATVVIEGEGGYEVTTTVAVADLPDLEIGASASIVPDGASSLITGEVVSIGVAATSSGTTTSYPVTVALTGATSDLGNGSTASVVITTAASADVLAVPISAVTVEGDRHTVEVVVDGAATTIEVEVGAVGTDWIEITDGLSVGDQVALADLDEPLPGSVTEPSGRSDSGGAGGVGNGGRTGGWTPSGPPG